MWAKLRQGYYINLDVFKRIEIGANKVIGCHLDGKHTTFLDRSDTTHDFDANVAALREAMGSEINLDHRAPTAKEIEDEHYEEMSQRQTARSAPPPGF